MTRTNHEKGSGMSEQSPSVGEAVISGSGLSSSEIEDLLQSVCSDVRVLAISGFFQKEDIDGQLGQKIKGFLPKPCSWSTLIEGTRTALS